MTDYIRRLVSGNKARFKDHNLNVDLDLVYVTDQVIIMGYPASGLEGLYRNRKEDAIKFLEHRHGKNYWVFNFCPIKENSYEPDVFEGRVSRYPFPDHHAPPLAVMPLVAREMHAWLNGSPERVAVLHCKAGKGRSGTMACSYLLSLDDTPTSPQLERSHNAKDWAKRRTERTIDALPIEEESTPVLSPHPHPAFAEKQKSPTSDAEGILDVDTGAPPRAATPNREKSFTDALKGVLDLHTAQRMKPMENEKDGKTVKGKQGVSIPSQRRFLNYWALLLAHEAPQHMWERSITGKDKGARPKVRLTKLTLRMSETSSVRKGIVKAANMLMDRAKGATEENGSANQVWASLARYDDALVDLLEEWEARTRDPEGNMGKRRLGSERKISVGAEAEESLNEIFDDGRWDKGKMVRSFARLGVVNNSVEKVVDDKGEKMHIYTLTPLSDKRWEGLRHDLDQSTAPNHPERQQTLEAIDSQAHEVGVSHSEANSVDDVSVAPAVALGTKLGEKEAGVEEGIVLDAGREVRVKLYVGQVFIGWMWFIPTFHMPQPPPTASLNATSLPQPVTSTKATFSLTRKDIDFPLGLGSSIIDVDIEMEWVMPFTAAATPLGKEVEPAGTGALGAVLQAVGAGGQGGDVAGGMGTVGLREAVEARQGGGE